MSPDDEQELLREIKALRRDVRRMRVWVIFTGIGMAFLLFGGWILFVISRLIESTKTDWLLAPAIAIVVLFILAAVVVSRLVPDKPKPDFGTDEGRWDSRV